jgi:hypothetical protein
MVHFVDIGGRDRPVCFSYSVAYEYELQTGKFYAPDVQELAMQVITAGAALGTDDVATAARSVSIVKFTDIIFAALLVGARKEKQPADFTKYDVADWMGGNPAAAGRLTELLLSANFNLKPDAPSENGHDETGDAAKKKTPAQ